MATWISHLRIAENILNNNNNLDQNTFVAGNIAPDAGVPNEDWSKFDPPSNITHWKNSEGKVIPDSFFDKYIDLNDEENNHERFSFLLGYYTHLLADVEWEKFYQYKMKDPLHKEGLEKDPKFIWRIKEDWYGQDFDYLKGNENSLFFTCFQHLVEVEDYLDYFPKGAFTNRFKYIREMYLKNYKNNAREYIFLTKDEMDQYVETATNNILSIIQSVVSGRKQS